MDPIFSPVSVAVIGASRDRSSIGWALMDNLISRQFEGPIFPVNPKADSVHSLKCYPSVTAIPDPVELAVVLVPQPYVEEVVDECLEVGVRGLVVISAGFAETGEEGAEIERRIRDKVRGAGARMVGPNCMGVINTDAEISLDATFAPTPARAGHIGFVSQSGALGVAILNVAAALGIGFTQFVSMGNKADVSGNDLLTYWKEDPETRVICMYLESFGNPRRFTELAKEVGRKKPILVVKSGRTQAGARAASSHTGALAGLDVTVSAFLEQCGVIRANRIEELFDIARALDRCPLPAGNRVAIVTNAGGPGIMATDACVNLGLEMAELSEETRDELASFLPEEASLENPVDMIASATPENYRRALECVLADESVDMALAINVTPLLSAPTDVLEEATAGCEGTPDKPVLAVIMAKESFYEEIQGREDLLPVYHFPESAAMALSKLSRYAAWRGRPVEEKVPVFDVDDDRVDEILRSRDEGYLPPEEAFPVLETYGIPVIPWRRVPSRAEALEAAGELGFPVVLKAVAPDLVHKSDVGGVAVDLRNEEELSEALDEMTESLEAEGHQAQGFLLQKLARGGQEVIFGISTDPRFGPLLMFGLGGKYVEVFQDVRFAVTPLAPSEARDVIQGIQGHDLLEGVRGEEGVDLDLMEEVLLRIAQMAQRHPRIRELDLNPFLAAPSREASAALDVRIRVGEPERGVH